MSTEEVYQVYNHTQFVGVFNIEPYYPATRFQPAEGGAIIEELWAHVEGAGREVEEVRLNPDNFPAIVDSMRSELETDLGIT